MKSKIIFIGLFLLSFFSIKSNEVTSLFRKSKSPILEEVIIKKHIDNQEQPKEFKVSTETQERALRIFSHFPNDPLIKNELSKEEYFRRQLPSNLNLSNLNRKLEVESHFAKLEEIKNLFEPDVKDLLDYLFYKYSLEHPDIFPWDLEFAIANLFPKIKQDAYKSIAKIYKEFSKDYPNSTHLSYHTNLKDTFNALTKFMYHLRNFLEFHFITTLTPQNLNLMAQFEQGSFNRETKTVVKDKLYQIYNEFGPEFLNDLFLVIIKEGAEEIKNTSYEMQLKIIKMILNLFNEFIQKYKIPINDFKGSIDDFKEYLEKLKTNQT